MSITLSDGTTIDDFTIRTDDLFSNNKISRIFELAYSDSEHIINQAPKINQIIFRNWFINKQSDSFFELKFATVIFSARGNFPRNNLFLEGPVFNEYPYDLFKITLPINEIDRDLEKILKQIAPKS